MSVKERTGIQHIADLFTSTHPGTRRRSSANLEVTELERRLTPSATLQAALPAAAPVSDAAHSAQQSVPSQASESGPLVAAPQPKAVINFSRFQQVAAAGTAYSFTVKMSDRAGNTYEDTFNIPAGTPVAQVRTLVRESMASDGWQVSESAELGLVVSGKTTGGLFSPISKIKFDSKQLKPEALPSVSSNSGVEVGQQTQGTNWKVTISSTPDAATVEGDAQISLTLNGLEFKVAISEGQTPEDVAYALYQELILNDVDATLSGSTIEFLALYGGEEEVTDVWVAYSETDDIPACDWLATEIVIAEREII